MERTLRNFFGPALRELKVAEGSYGIQELDIRYRDFINPKDVVKSIHTILPGVLIRSLYRELSDEVKVMVYDSIIYGHQGLKPAGDAELWRKVEGVTSEMNFAD